MNLAKKEILLPYISVASLFIFFLFDSMILNKSIRGAWIFLSFVLISSDFFYSYVNRKSLPKENRNQRFIVYGLGMSAFLLYHLRVLLDFPVAPGISEEATNLPRVRDFILALVVILSFSFLVYTILLENARRSMTSSNALTVRKYGLLQSFIFSFLMILPVLIGVNYIAVMKNYNFDLTAIGKYSFSPTTRAILKNVKKEIQVYAFYPRHLESSGPESSFALSVIRPDVEIVLDQLKAINPLISVKFINADVETDLLGNIGQASNGSILIRTLKETSFGGSPYAEQRIYIQDSSELEDIERKLTQAILNISTTEKTIYMTTSNGERFGIGFQSVPNQQVNKFISGLNFLNFKVKPLGVEEKWPAEIPNDADAVVIIGPTVPFSKEAKEALLNYITNKNGNLFITIDPVGVENFEWLLEKANLIYNREIISQPNGRYGILIAKNFGKHPIEEILEKKNLGLIYPYSGSFSIKGNKQPPSFDTSLILESGFDTFIDPNGNGKLDGKETKANFHLGYALQLINDKKDGNKTSGSRVVVFSGTSWITDQYYSLNVNSGFSTNSMNWILQREVLSGIVPKKTDIQAINLTDNQKQIVWVFGMFGFPGVIILAGLVVVLMRKKSRAV